MPEHGQSLNALLPHALPSKVFPIFLDGFRNAAQDSNCGMMNPVPASVFGISDKNQPSVDRRGAPQLMTDLPPIAVQI